jgi:hypothetical protein
MHKKKKTIGTLFITRVHKNSDREKVKSDEK